MAKSLMRIAAESGKSLPKRINFTVAALAGITCPAGRDRVYVYDAKVPGLCAAITATGARSYFLLKKLDGRTRRVRLGGAEITIEQARRLAAEKNGEIAQGIDPTAAKRAMRQSDTLQQLFDRWGEEHAKVRLADRTRATDKSRFDTCLAPLASRRVLGITESDVRALHAKVGRERGKVSANRSIQLLRRLLNWGKIVPNPAAKAVDLFTERSRERFVLPAEMGPLFNALDDEKTNPLIRDFIYLCLWTGQRRSCVQSMADAEIDFDRAVWTIPAEKAKGKRPIHVPLVTPALEIIKRRMGHKGGFILPSHGKAGHLVEPKAGWKDVLVRAGLKDVTVHDLRRSFGSYQAALGASLPTIGASLGHANLAATQIYSRLSLEPVRASVGAAVQAMQAAATAKPAATAPTPSKPIVQVMEDEVSATLYGE